MIKWLAVIWNAEAISVQRAGQEQTLCSVLTNVRSRGILLSRQDPFEGSFRDIDYGERFLSAL
jgi:hypothetical protein